jgi:hypothetical protein
MNESMLNILIADILGNKEFRRIFRENVEENPWLLNYELGSAMLPESEGGGEGTVYTRSYDNTVVPTIMLNEDSGNLQYYGDNEDELFKIIDEKGYGIPFSSEKQAKDFSKWLSKLHEMIGITQQSYEI